MDAGLTRAVEEATIALGRLDSIPDFVADGEILMYFYLRREAVHSSQIEGTQASLDDLLALDDEDSVVRRHLDRWLAYRYNLAISLVRRAAREFAEERRRSGMLNFHDLLALTARLLREHPTVRRDLGKRYRYTLVDEFQDTDPIQAELPARSQLPSASSAAARTTKIASIRYSRPRNAIAPSRMWPAISGITPSPASCRLIHRLRSRA